MADRLPLLIFPEPRPDHRPKSRGGFSPEGRQLPSHDRQVERLGTQIEKVQSDFQKFKGVLGETIAGGEPELVLVLELADKVDSLIRAVHAADLEWLGEWDVDVEVDEDFLQKQEKDSRDGQKKYTRDGRLFVSMFNEQGMSKILRFWELWKEDPRKLPQGATVWRDIFACLKNIRRWGQEETLVETGMKDYFEGLLEEEEPAYFQIECFYREDKEKRKRVEESVRGLVEKYNHEGEKHGGLDSKFIHISDIAFHAVKAHMRVSDIRALLNSSGDDAKNINIFISPYVMYFRQAGQSITSAAEDDGKETQYPRREARHPPIAAVLDGVPNVKHEALENRIDFDDPFDLAGKYRPGERRHGTQISSLIIHGDYRSIETAKPIRSKIHHVAVIQPNIKERGRGRRDEHFPVDCFCEDRIEQAVRRIIEGDGEVEAQAPTVKIINLSLGDPNRPFINVPSPWARLLDWLSWKYRVLFCVSSGNYTEPYNFGIPCSEYERKSDDEKKGLLLQSMHENSSDRKLISPAESINALTIGALHQDESGNNYDKAHRIDLLPDNNLPSPICRLGQGFKRSVKPEIYFPGGRQLYTEPMRRDNKVFEISEGTSPPGQNVAWDSEQEGKLSEFAHSRGTSNATALATRAGVQIHEMLERLNHANNDRQILDSAAVLIKTLLVHGGVHNKDTQQVIKKYLHNKYSTRESKTVLTHCCPINFHSNTS